MFVPPFFLQLQKTSKNILLAGMGGGYDVFAGIPLYFELKQTNLFNNIVLANLSFTGQLTTKDIGEKVTPQCLEVRFSDYIKSKREHEYDSHLGYPKNYFCEWHLSRWFHQKHNSDVPIYAFSLSDMGVKELTTAYKALIDRYNIDTIILVDAGVDSLLKNDEEGMGTFGEDLLSILALKQINTDTSTLKHKYLMCVGLSTEGGISEFDFLENWAAIQTAGGFLGAVSWHSAMYSVQQYVDALQNSCPTNSTINAQIVCSLEGIHGPYLPDYLKSRIKHPMHINPLMAMSWYFDLDVVTNYKKYMDRFDAATSLTNLQSKMEVARFDDKLVGRRNGNYSGTRKYRSWFD